MANGSRRAFASFGIVPIAKSFSQIEDVKINIMPSEHLIHSFTSGCALPFGGMRAGATDMASDSCVENGSQGGHARRN